jgi:hypothetical protein
MNFAKLQLMMLISLTSTSIAQASDLVFLECNVNWSKKYDTSSTFPKTANFKIDLKSKIIYILKGKYYFNECSNGMRYCSVIDNEFIISEIQNVKDGSFHETKTSINRYSGQINATYKIYVNDVNIGRRKLKSMDTVFSGICKKGIDLAPKKF